MLGTQRKSPPRGFGAAPTEQPPRKLSGTPDRCNDVDSEKMGFLPSPMV